jgi:hypothetical protein
VGEIKKAKENENDLVIFPEMAVAGYLIGDEWENESLIKNLMEINEKIREESEGITVIWGNVWADFEKIGEDGRVRKYNAALIAQDKKWLDNGVFEGHTFKTLLPKYREFDDERYLSGELVSVIKGYKINKKKINIYDSNDNLVFETYGTFNEICQAYNLPFTALKNSYLRNEKIYQKIGSNMSRLEKNGYIQYVGWYAKIID